MALIEAIQSIPNFDIVQAIQVLSFPLLGITLRRAARTKATILANNLPKEELLQLKDDMRTAIIREENAQKGYGKLTLDDITNASIARVVQTKIKAAIKRRDKPRAKK